MYENNRKIVFDFFSRFEDSGVEIGSAAGFYCERFDFEAGHGRREEIGMRVWRGMSGNWEFGERLGIWGR